mgnify:CR=1 FL=1
MYKYHCLNPISPVGMGQLDANYENTENAADADVILVRSAKMHEMEFGENLKAIARAGAGVNNIPLDRCAEEGIVVFNTPGANANGVKELVIAGMLLAARDIVGGINWVKGYDEDGDIAKAAEKKKKAFAGTELKGKKLGVIGLGAIGVLVANAATHLGMEVYGYDPYVSVDSAWRLSRNIHHAKTADEIYKECDYITIHVPALEDTKGMINKDAMGLMKDGVVILNFARDLLVDEDAVLAAIADGKVKKYVSDFPNATTAGQPGVIVIPHLGASTEESEDNCARMAVKEIRDFLENGNIQHSVNYPDCDMGPATKPGRIAICHKNVKNMITQFSGVISGADINITDMVNKSRGDYAYTIIDLADQPTEENLAALRAIEGMISVRAI